MRKSTVTAKKTTVSVDENLLKEASKIFGEKSGSAVLNRALEEVVKIEKVRRLRSFIGKDIWKGSLSEMRRDAKSSYSGRR